MTYMFVFETIFDNGTTKEYYKNLNDVPTTENQRVKIYPVLYSGNEYEDEGPENIRYENGSWVPEDCIWEYSFLRYILADPVEEVDIVDSDLDSVVIYENRAFHCKDDLLNWLVPEVKQYPLKSDRDNKTENRVTIEIEEGKVENCYGTVKCDICGHYTPVKDYEVIDYDEMPQLIYSDSDNDNDSDRHSYSSSKHSSTYN